jgi:hypothetical protein
MARKTKTGTNAVNHGPFSTLEAARDAKPADDGKAKLFSVARPDGEPLFVWAGSAWDAVHRTVRALGWKATALDKLPTKDDVAASLDLLTEEDRAAVLAKYKKR